MGWLSHGPAVMSTWDSLMFFEHDQWPWVTPQWFLTDQQPRSYWPWVDMIRYKHTIHQQFWCLAGCDGSSIIAISRIVFVYFCCLSMIHEQAIVHTFLKINLMLQNFNKDLVQRMAARGKQKNWPYFFLKVIECTGNFQAWIHSMAKGNGLFGLRSCSYAATKKADKLIPRI